MTEPPRDWDRELAEVDRMMAKQGSLPPAAPSSSAAPAGAPATVPAAGPGALPPGRPVPRPAAPTGAVAAPRRSVALTWFWTLLAVGLAIALPLWPYPRGCGLQLFFFMGATALTALVALLGARASWTSRRGFAHVLSLLVLVWAGAVAARDILPRVGYARSSLTWMCTTEPAAPGGPAPGGPATGGQRLPSPAP